MSITTLAFIGFGLSLVAWALTLVFHSNWSIPFALLGIAVSIYCMVAG